jgi:diguanylate cyclase (GGDEF)-like protein
MMDAIESAAGSTPNHAAPDAAPRTAPIAVNDPWPVVREPAVAPPFSPAVTFGRAATSRAAELRALHHDLHAELAAPPRLDLLRERIDRELERISTQDPAVVMLLLDLDGFTLIHDAYGGDLSDELLWIMAARLARVLQPGDIVCKMGGDLFGCLFAEPVDAGQARRCGDALVEALRAPFSVGPIRLRIRPGFAVAMYPTDDATAETLLKYARVATNRANRKQAGWAFERKRDHEPADRPMTLADPFVVGLADTRAA